MLALVRQSEQQKEYMSHQCQENVNEKASSFCWLSLRVLFYSIGILFCLMPNLSPIFKFNCNQSKLNGELSGTLAEVNIVELLVFFHHVPQPSLVSSTDPMMQTCRQGYILNSSPTILWFSMHPEQEEYLSYHLLGVFEDRVDGRKRFRHFTAGQVAGRLPSQGLSQ